MLSRLDSALTYEVHPANNVGTIHDAITSQLQFHHSEALRFLLMFKSVFCLDQSSWSGTSSSGTGCFDGRFFLVTCSSVLKGVVFLHSNGSFASTTGRCGHDGVPDELCMAVVRKGYAIFNAKAHCHPAYCQPELSLLPLASLNMVPIPHITSELTVTEPNESCSWNFCYELTRGLWEQHSGLLQGLLNPDQLYRNGRKVLKSRKFRKIGMK